MTPWEAREIFLENLASERELKRLQEQGLYHRYIYGEVDVEAIYKELKDQGI